MHSSPKKHHEVEVFGDVDPWFDYKKSKAIELRGVKLSSCQLHVLNPRAMYIKIIWPENEQCPLSIDVPFHGIFLFIFGRVTSIQQLGLWNFHKMAWHAEPLKTMPVVSQQCFFFMGI